LRLFSCEIAFLQFEEVTMSSMNRLVVLVSLFAVGTGTMAASSNVVIACYSLSTGDVRIVSKVSECTSKEKSITWDIKGPEGPEGPKGLTGLRGATGLEGPKGAIGPKGATGAIGANGAIGPQGPAGITGATGSTGPAGPAGPQGTTGAAGTAGSQGKTGSQGPGGFTGIQFFTTPGTSQFTVPAGITHVMVELIGGGGEGGGNMNQSYAGGGGGGGAYTKALLTVTSGAAYNVVVGAGGAGQPGNGGSGGMSQFTDAGADVLAFANGGGGGIEADNGGAGGAGGSNESNPALFASPGIAGPNTAGQEAVNGPLPINGLGFVTNGTLYGTGGQGQYLTYDGKAGFAGAVLITY
jgi:hypothetical protein